MSSNDVAPHTQPLQVKNPQTPPSILAAAHGAAPVQRHMPDFIAPLLALYQACDWREAAQMCHLSEAQLRALVARWGVELGQKLVEKGEPFAGFTPPGEQVDLWTRRLTESADDLKTRLVRSRKQGAVASLIQRRSISPKRLSCPGPQAADFDFMIEVALSAPGHGGVHPWRLLIFGAQQRHALADLFIHEKLCLDPLASRGDVDRAQEHATRSPFLTAIIVSLQECQGVPIREQWLPAGATMGNLFNAAYQLGFGAIVLSGERCFHPELKEGRVGYWLTQVPCGIHQQRLRHRRLSRTRQTASDRRRPACGRKWVHGIATAVPASLKTSVQGVQ